MKKEQRHSRKTKRIFATFASLVLALGVGVALAPRDVVKAEAAESVLTLDKLGTNLGSEYSDEIQQTIVNGYSLNYKQGKKQGDSIILQKSKNAFISNKTPLPGKITSIQVFINSGASGSATYRVNFSNSEILSDPGSGTAENIVGGGSHTFNNTSDSTYFVVSLGASKNGQVLKLEISYESGGGQPAPTLEGISVKSGTAPSKLNYYVGDVFDPTGVTIEASYSDGTKKDVTSLATFPMTPLTLGTTSVTVTYEGKETIISGLSVESIPVLKSIYVTGTPSKTTYYDDENFDPSGITVYAKYDKGDDVNVTSMVTYSPSPLVAGSTSVTATYNGKTATISGLTVSESPYSTVKYDITKKDTLSASGIAPSASSASLVETYNTSQQITGGNSQTLTLTNYTSVKLVEIKMSMKSNTSKGGGKLEYSVNNGGSYNTLISDSKFNEDSWYGAWSTTFVDVVKTIDIDVASSIIFKVSATESSLYVASYSFKWEQQTATLTGLTMNKPTVSIVEEETEQLAVTPVPALASYDVTWSSSNTSAATVDQNGVVTAVAAGKGTATITATDKTNNLIKATSVVTVLPMPAYDYFEKITDESKLHFGATYVIANEEGTLAMKNEQTGNNVPSQETILKDGKIRDNDNLMKVRLEVGAVKGTYALKTISTHTASNGKYLYAAGGTSNNYLKLETKISGDSSWLISFDEGVASIVAQGASDRNYLRFNENKGNPIFSSYAVGSSVQTHAALFLLEDSVDPVVEAQAFVDAANTGKGEGAQGACKEAYEFLDDVLNRLSDEALEELLYSEEENFVKAVERYDYLEAWVALNDSPGSLSEQNKTTTNTLVAALVIGAIGITTLGGYFFLNKKRHLEK